MREGHCQRVALERRPPGQALIGDHPQAVQVTQRRGGPGRIPEASTRSRCHREDGLIVGHPFNSEFPAICTATQEQPHSDLRTDQRDRNEATAPANTPAYACSASGQGTVASPVYVSALARLQLSGWCLGLTGATCSSIAGLGGTTVWGSRVPGLSGRPLANHSHLRAA